MVSAWKTWIIRGSLSHFKMRGKRRIGTETEDSKQNKVGEQDSADSVKACLHRTHAFTNKRHLDYTIYNISQVEWVCISC